MNQASEDCQSSDCGGEPAVFGVDLSRRRFIVSAGAFAAGLNAGPLRADVSGDSYADLLKSEPTLRGYWRFDGDLVDVLGKANAKGSGSVSFVGGAVEGQAISLEPMSHC